MKRTICSILSSLILASCTGIQINEEKETFYFETIYGFHIVDWKNQRSLQYINILGNETCRAIEDHGSKKNEISFIDNKCDNTEEVYCDMPYGDTKIHLKKEEKGKELRQILLQGSYILIEKDKLIKDWKKKHYIK